MENYKKIEVRDLIDYGFDLIDDSKMHFWISVPSITKTSWIMMHIENPRHYSESGNTKGCADRSKAFSINELNFWDLTIREVWTEEVGDSRYASLSKERQKILLKETVSYMNDVDEICKKWDILQKTRGDYKFD